MKILIATDIHVHIIDGKYYLATQLYSIINRYYEEFGPVIMYCRVSYGKTSEKLIDSTDIVDKIISFNNIFEIITKKNNKQVDKAIKGCDLVVGRFHSFSACQCAKIAKKNKKIFLAEVMGDAWDGYWNHGIVGKIIAPYIFIKTKISIYNADFSLYVTEKYLQKKYPTKGICINASNVRITDVKQEILNEKLKQIDNRSFDRITLMTAANVDVKAKGHEYVIKAIPKLLKKNIKVDYYIAGGGNNTYLNNIATKLDIQESIHFLGRKTPEEIFKLMDKIDIYIQPSLQEGLPRSVIEAMSRGCFVIGSCTAGIPELLDKKFIFKRKNSRDIANKILMYKSMDKDEKKKNLLCKKGEQKKEIQQK